MLLEVAAGLGALAIYCFLVLPRVGRRFFRSTGQSRTLRFAFMLFAFASAGVLAELFGIEGLVGAFLAGLGVNGLAPKGGPLLERVDFFGEALFVPAFLIYVGTKLNPAVLVLPSTVTMALVFMAALFGGKALAATVTGRVLKFSWPEVGLVFGMTIPQAAATLAATLVGAEAGLFTDQVVNAVVFIVLVSIVLGSVLTRRFANRVELPAQSQRPVGAAVLVGLLGSTPSQLLVTVAASVAAENHGLVMPVAVSTRDDRAVADAERIAEEATKAAEAQGADVEARVRFADSYAAAMLEAIIDRRASALVTPLSTDPGIVGRLFGGELERIGRESPDPGVCCEARPREDHEGGAWPRLSRGHARRCVRPAPGGGRGPSACGAPQRAACGGREQRRADRRARAGRCRRAGARQASDREPPGGAGTRVDLRRAGLACAAAGSVRERVRPQPRRHSAPDRGGSLPVARVAGRRAGVELPGRAGGYDCCGGDAAAGGGRVGLRSRRGPVGQRVRRARGACARARPSPRPPRRCGVRTTRRGSRRPGPPR